MTNRSTPIFKNVGDCSPKPPRINAPAFAVVKKRIGRNLKVWFQGLLILTIYTVSQKNDTDIAHYNFKAHQPILVIFGRGIAERISY